MGQAEARGCTPSDPRQVPARPLPSALPRVAAPVHVQRGAHPLGDHTCRMNCPHSWRPSYNNACGHGPVRVQCT